MPNRIRLTALIANGVLCPVFGFVALYGLSDQEPGVAVFFSLAAATAGFNWHVIRKAARLLSEEEWLQAELRKAELRRRIAELDGMAPPPQPQGPDA